MIRIMIVDDMPIFLEYLRGCIDWSAYGFTICCQASDGREALEKIEEYYPDVVLTDITMPYVDGLELAEIIAQKYKDISVILITGNNEFEYARKAVKIGVCDYIVKPFEKEELILSLLKLQDNIGKMVENSESTPEKANIEEKLKALIYAGVGASATDENEALKLFYDANKIDSESGYLLALVKFDFNNLSNSGEITVENLINWEKLIARMLEDKLDIDGTFRVFHDYENNIVVIMSFDNEDALKSYKGYELTDMVQVIKNCLGIDCAIGLIGAANIREVKNSYEMILGYLGKKSSGQFYDIRGNKETFMHGSLDAILRLNKDIETLQEEDVEDVINELWRSVGNQTTESGFTCMNLLSSAISILMTNIISSGFSIEQIYGDNFSPDRFIASGETLEKMKDNLVQLYRKRILFEKVKKDTKTSDIASAAKKFIEDNYSNSELAISDISESLCVNQTYLRKMFKSEMNMTLTEYITQYRMQEARKLITTTDEKLSTIAEKIGFSDVSYFSNVFKKYYGISPRSMGKS